MRCFEDLDGRNNSPREGLHRRMKSSTTHSPPARNTCTSVRHASSHASFSACSFHVVIQVVNGSSLQQTMRIFKGDREASNIDVNRIICSEHDAIREV